MNKKQSTRFKWLSEYFYQVYRTIEHFEDIDEREYEIANECDRNIFENEFDEEERLMIERFSFSFSLYSGEIPKYYDNPIGLSLTQDLVEYIKKKHKVEHCNILFPESHFMGENSARLNIRINSNNEVEDVYFG